jgi:alcohol dehydrogenase (NADP+)
MEKLVRPVNGTRFIGISNHSPQQVKEILAVATIRPKVHQFELHPYLPQTDWVAANLALNLTVTGYAPLGNTNPIHNLGVSGAKGRAAPLLLGAPAIARVAAARGCTPAQAVLAWNLRRGVVVIPKASQEAHQKENIATVDKCRLTDEDVVALDGLKVPLRLYPNACGYGLTEGCQ